MNDKTQDLDRPRAAATLVEHQAGSVVSRTLLKHSSGNVTVFAFGAGQELSEHTAAHDALVHVVEGQALITVGGQPHTVRAGELLLLPASIPHAVAAAQPFKMLLTMLRP